MSCQPWVLVSANSVYLERGGTCDFHHCSRHDETEQRSFRKHKKKKGRKGGGYVRRWMCTCPFCFFFLLQIVSTRADQCTNSTRFSSFVFFFFLACLLFIYCLHITPIVVERKPKKKRPRGRTTEGGNAARETLKKKNEYMRIWPQKKKKRRDLWKKRGEVREGGRRKKVNHMINPTYSRKCERI